MQAEVYFGTCGDNLSWELNSEDSTLTIEGSGEMIVGNNYDTHAPWYEYYENIANVILPEGLTNVAYYAFVNCYNIRRIDIPSSVSNINIDAFVCCWGLTHINVDTENLYYSSIDGVVFDKQNSTIILYPPGKEGVYTIPDNTAVIGESAFEGCNKLTSIDIPNSVIEIQSAAFFACDGLSNVIIPNSVVSIGDAAFSHCRNLISIELPNSVTSIGNEVFRSCNSLQSPVYNAHIFARLPMDFNGRYIIPDGVNSIAGGAFYECTNLTSVIIPRSVESLGSSVFVHCSGLTEIYNYALSPQSIYTSADLNGVNINECVLYVPAESIELYQSAFCWRNFKYILPISDAEEEEVNVKYLNKAGSVINSERVTLTLPTAPKIDGFTFLKWKVVESDLTDGISIQAIYTANVPTEVPAELANPKNPAQKLVRNGNVYILTEEKTYTITGQTVKK